MFKPMLAATWTPGTELSYPLLVSPKLDGVRCIVRDGVAYSRNMKPIRNEWVQHVLGACAWLDSLDGELIVGAPTGGNVLGRTQSGVMAREGRPEFMFHVFDDTSAALGFSGRLHGAKRRVASAKLQVASMVPHEMAHSFGQLEKLERTFLAQGYEGAMLRHPDGPYKQGRATPKEGTLWKMKRFIDGEAVIIGLEEGEANENIATRDELGRTKRSSAKAGKVAAGRVGTILATNLTTGQAMRISPGCLTAAERAHYWQHPQQLVGHVCTFKAFDYGVKDALRFALFKALRDPIDVPRKGE